MAKKYDVIVVGAGNGGLSAAAFWQRMVKKYQFLKNIICQEAVQQVLSEDALNLKQLFMRCVKWAMVKILEL